MENLVATTIALFILMDFVGTIPVFITLTQEKRNWERVKIAILASLAATIVIILFTTLGKYIMGYFDLSLEALKVGGGLMMIYIAFEMIFSGQLVYEKGKYKSVIIAPLAIPMLAGPGSIAFAMIKYLENSQEVILALLICCIIGSLLLSASLIIDKILHRELIRGLEKITAILLAVIASEMIMSGIKTYFF